ncbi:Transglutaminase domain-containing protein [Planktothrix sp. PCC 11201]|uniref:transglutaminase-like domain-containing protein n=1 Tax=Planktothrix sp. PCC 11201 TaxID=1729650 RepID=UPI00090EF913|nr:transglutaminase-like domain-containing protein [Planktothrix sp. PCC 11201]SKB11087.1 Transglutaminase domain-containing protein [Planktothrix sp. PCC 11201]
MKTPALLLGTTLIFWGWQTGLLIFALPMALILEGYRWIQWRWDVSSEDIKNIENFCLIVVVLVTLVLILSNRSIQFIYTLLQWLPVLFFPLVMTQTYSVSDRINIHKLFLFLNIFSSLKNTEGFYLNLTYPYFVLCLISTSAANLQNLSFYGGMFILVAIPLFLGRSKRFSPLIWTGLMIGVGTLGLVGFVGLHRLHLTFEQAVIEQLSGLSSQDADPFQRRTAMGDIGVLKLSNSIFFRVATEDQQTTPILLRQSTYNKYNLSTWLVTNPEFQSIQSAQNSTTWLLTKPHPNHSQITISGQLQEGKGLLKLPNGAFQVNQLPVLSLEKNQYGTVKVEGKPDLISYQILFNSSVNLDSPPTEADLQIPNSEKPAIAQIVKELDLKGKPPQEILNRVQDFFDNNFNYSLQLLGQDLETTSLSTFLLKNRSGHCEYFATATTLLLREMGIPARYAIGFSVSEFSPLENQFIVRGRDSHAWTLVYLDGVWQNFDTTPAGWSAFEDAAAPPWELITDIWSFLGFQLTLFLKYIQTINLLKYSRLFMIPVLLIVGFQAKKRVHRFKSTKIRSQPILTAPKPGTDSDFYRIEKSLNELGFFRHPSESLKSWMKRLKRESPQNPLMNDLSSMVELHYRYRFDPEGINQAEKQKLNEMIESWLNSYQKLD